jgi:hypothetical protein
MTHPLHRNENIFPFSTADAAAEVLELLRAIVAPSELADVGAQLHHFTTGTVDLRTTGCSARCPYSTTLLATGDSHGLCVTGPQPAAEAARARRAALGRRWDIRLRRTLDDLLWKLL